MKRLGFFGACVAVDGALSAFAHARLPERVPVHWGADGLPDGWGPRAMITVGGFALTLVVGAMLALLRDRGALPSREVQGDEADLGGAARDAERAERGVGARDAVEASTLMMLVGIHAAILAAAGGVLPDIRRGIAFAFAFFAVVAGNAYGQLRPNRFVGVRSRATMSDPLVWRRTHRLGGRLMVAAGLVCAAVGLFWPTTAGFATAFVVFMAAALAPLPYAAYIARAGK